MDQKLDPLDFSVVLQYDGHTTTPEDVAVDLHNQQYSCDAAIEDADNSGVAATDDEGQIGDSAAEEDTDHGCQEYTGGIAATVDSADNLPNLAADVSTKQCDLSEEECNYNGESHAASSDDEGNWKRVTYTKRRMNNNNKSTNGNASNSRSRATDYTVVVANNTFSSLLDDHNKDSKKKRRKRKKTKKKNKPMVEEPEKMDGQDEAVKIDGQDEVVKMDGQDEAMKMDGQDDLPAILPQSRQFAKSGLGCGGILVIVIVLAVRQWLLYSCRILLGVSRI